ncbi:MAG: hypothetical protein IJQ82_03085 [Selenomonadaceae bacterium]|nr:hypothetical protein [Selenomonadaceae bacterium]
MRQIKFRGVDVVTKKYVYGPMGNLGGLPLIEWPQGLVLVEEGSLKQLVGRDKNGREVYEDDLVKAPFEPEPFKADMSDVLRIDLYELVEK